MIYIYALTDPFTGAIRYIGKSIRPEERLNNHCNDNSITYRTNWIKSVIAKGKRPLISILETLDDDADWQGRERYWIAHGRNLGWSLTNCTDGGDGVVNLPPEIRSRISRTWIGRKHKQSSLELIGNASKGRTHTQEYKDHMREIMSGREITWTDKVSKALQKLSDEEVMEIRSLLKNKVSQYVIADKFNVHQSTISGIKLGKIYKSVQ